MGRIAAEIARAGRVSAGRPRPHGPVTVDLGSEAPLGRSSVRLTAHVTASTTPPVLIVGAGLSGLVAANSLASAGRACIVIDEGAVPGGRLSTRVLGGPGRGPARLDDGAQFFTVRSPDFAEIVHDWRRAGIVREWCRGFSAAGDGYPRYCAEAGMRTIGQYLASSVDVRSGVVARAVAGHDGCLAVSAADGTRWESNAVILTPPVPYSLALCDNGWLPVPDAALATLRAVRYAPCLALLLTLDGPSAVPYPGGLQLTAADDGGMFTFVADNGAKGISDVPALTLHANDEISAAHFDDDENDLRALLLSAAAPYLGAARVLDIAVTRWRYARPTVGHPSHCLATEPIAGTTLVFTGDAFGDAKVEGAALSGLAAAEAVLLAH